VYTVPTVPILKSLWSSVIRVSALFDYALFLRSFTYSPTFAVYVQFTCALPSLAMYFLLGFFFIDFLTVLWMRTDLFQIQILL
jgi:hypothetical protein